MENDQKLKIFLWLLLGIILIQVVLGGVTRLTESGLSITRWDLITGVLPPIGASEWEGAFDLYKKSPQYAMINEGMTLSEFKKIYFWEWLHRNWGRFGMLFLFGGLLYFYKYSKLSRSWYKYFIYLLLLYALQGVIGWYMVASGLRDMPYVSHFRLAMHFVTALLLTGYVVRLLAILYVNPEQLVVNSNWKSWSLFLTGLILLQIIYGAFMSGLRAALEFPSWPLMNGRYFPENLYLESYSLAHNLFSHKPMVQFIHRHLGYLVAIMVIVFIYKLLSASFQKPRLFHHTAKGLGYIVIIQVLLGILTLVFSKRGIPISLGAMHQMGGLVLLNGMLFLYWQLSGKSARSMS